MTKDKTISKTIRRIIGISALVFWAIVVLPYIILPAGDRLAWQLQHWMLIPASVLTTVYVIMLTIHNNKSEQNIIIMIRNWLLCCGPVLVCGAFLSVAIFKADYTVWNNGNYVIYGYIVSDNENGGFTSPSIYVLYKRKGIVDDRIGMIGDMRQYLYDTPDRSRIQNVDYTIYEAHNLIKEEMDYIPYESDSVCHLTSFYRLSNGEYYDQSQNNYLISLINQQ